MADLKDIAEMVFGKEENGVKIEIVDGHPNLKIVFVNTAVTAKHSTAFFSEMAKNYDGRSHVWAGVQLKSTLDNN